ncbi:pali-domain-containing protein [Hymenopellis radicata]|jgi:hypothetical protein|nr:pali-domain-containing protein [Hymenopellis radicata]
MTRAFCIPGILFLAVAFVLSMLVSISLPYLTALDIARTDFAHGGQVQGEGITEIRFGVWANCRYDTNGDRTCTDAHHGYSVFIQNADRTETVDIGASWTRGLAVHPVATAVTFIALCMSFSQHVTVTLLASITSFFAALLTLIAFAIDIALFAYLKHQVNKLNGLSPNTKPGPGFWLTFVSLILLLLAGCTVCFGRRKERMSSASSYPSYPMSSKSSGFLSRFRRN